jgi:hypothetical protein
MVDLFFLSRIKFKERSVAMVPYGSFFALHPANFLKGAVQRAVVKAIIIRGMT